MQQILYKRILLKLSGEALMGKNTTMFHTQTIENIIEQIKQLLLLKVQLGIVVGGGNIFRGNNSHNIGIDKINGDYVGMLATIMNGIVLKDLLMQAGVNTKIYSSLAISNLVKGYNRDSMLSRSINGDVILFVGGTGNPLFTTDSAAALRAVEFKADLLIKATKVDGVYDRDPNIFPDAKKYTSLTFNEAITQKLNIMDLAAFDLCKTHNLKIVVTDIFQANSLIDCVIGKTHGTLIYET
jgi:uridylate kinase